MIPAVYYITAKPIWLRVNDGGAAITCLRAVDVHSLLSWGFLASLGPVCMYRVTPIQLVCQCSIMETTRYSPLQAESPLTSQVE